MLMFALLGSAALPGRAAIATDSSPEFVLFLWDPVSRSSYSMDLGLNGYVGPDVALRQQSFWVNGQQDAGLQRFWSLDPAADANYARFRATAANLNNMVWAVIGVDATPPNDGTDPAAPGVTTTFMTLHATETQGVIGGAYSALSQLNNADYVLAAQQVRSELVNQLNIDALNAANNTHATGGTANAAFNGSSYDIEGGLSYFGKNAGLLTRFYASCNCDLTTPVGKSSWFYYVTTSDPFDLSVPVAIDEFDNLRNDAYWGVAQDPATGRLVLSYTLAPATLSSLAVTTEGRARAALTEYAAADLVRSVAAPAGEYAGYVMPAISPVPEPHALVLALFGGLLIAVRAYGRR